MFPVLSVTGVSHHTCPVEVREKFAAAEGHAPAQVDGAASESVWLSTCNRTEMYAISDESDAGGCAFSTALQIPERFVTEYAYVLEGAGAIRHLFRVASGLDSMVVGEGEILGQVRRALAEAQNLGSAGPILTRMFQDALAVGKRVRSETSINRFPASVSSAAASLIQNGIVDDLEDTSVLIIGAGDMARAMARCLKGMKVRDIAIVNRTRSHAESIARESGAQVLEWPITAERLAGFSAAMSCTSAPEFILTRETVEAATRRLRAGETLQLVDIAVPRDIDPCVSTVPGVHLTDIDDIQSIVDESLAMRSHYVEPAERIISDQLENFTEWMTTRSVSNSIQLLRDRADAIRARELDWALPKLSHLSQSELDVVAQLSNRLVKKLLHTPTLKLREAAAKGESEPVSELVHQLFELNGELEPTVKTAE